MMEAMGFVGGIDFLIVLLVSFTVLAADYEGGLNRRRALMILIALVLFFSLSYAIHISEKSEHEMNQKLCVEYGLTERLNAATKTVGMVRYCKIQGSGLINDFYFVLRSSGFYKV